VTAVKHLGAAISNLLPDRRDADKRLIVEV
jgi:hypothetical protein